MMAGRFHIAIRMIRSVLFAGMLLGLPGCAVVDGVKNAMKDAAKPDEPSCDLLPFEKGQISAAYLRWPSADARSHDVLHVTGRESRASLPQTLDLGGTHLDRISGADVRERGLRGTNRSTLKLRPGFASGAKLPNVYDLGYREGEMDYAGVMVAGASPGAEEIPSGGAASYSGRVVVGLGPALSGGSSAQAEGRFTLTVGYGTQRAVLRIDLTGGTLPFARLDWSNLYLCGTRLVSSGQGEVSVTDATGATAPPFGTASQPVPILSRFDVTLIAPVQRPAPPQGIGGVFLIQSDLGTLTGVFLSDQPGGSP